MVQAPRRGGGVQACGRGGSGKSGGDQRGNGQGGCVGAGDMVSGIWSLLCLGCVALAVLRLNDC